MSAARKVVPMYEGQDEDRELLLRELREEINNGKGIARIQAIKLFWEMMGKPTAKPAADPDADAPITFLIAGPLNDDELPGNQATARGSTAPSQD